MTDDPGQGDDKLKALKPMHVDYDEARSAEEMGTYHQPRLMAQGEFMLDAHPLARVRAVLARLRGVRPAGTKRR
jgi:hypothetical protein